MVCQKIENNYFSVIISDSFFLFSVNLNFFVEKHRKNSRDAYFSCLSSFIKSQSLIKRLETTADVVNAIHQGQIKSNQNRALKGYYFFKYIFYFIF